MSEHETMLVKLGKILDQVARPHPCDEGLPADVQEALWQLGVPCDELTPRAELVVRLWARRRSVVAATLMEWSSPQVTPPSAA
jgi:hypothetical protein